MALPITDYTAFFAGAKQAVQELEQLRERELCLALQRLLAFLQTELPFS